MSQTTIYDENVEWTTASAAGSFNFADNSTPHTGLIDLDVFHANPGDSGTFTAPANINSSLMSTLSLWINPVTWAAAAVVSLFWEDVNGNQLGNSVQIINGAFGFSNTTAAYQNLIIPVSTFAMPANSQVRKLALTASPKTFMSFFLDTVVLTTMALACTPAGLQAQDSCLDCSLTPKQQRSVQTYLYAATALAQGAVTSITASSLNAGSKCFDCLSRPTQEAVQIYLLCQLANVVSVNGGGLALSNSASALLKAAACLDCGLKPKEHINAQTYLLAQMALTAGVISSTTPSSLVAAAKCNVCALTSKMKQMVLTNLVCVVVNA